MLNRLLLLVLLGMLCGATARADLRFASMVVGSTTYTDVTIIDVSDTDMLFKHSTGMSNIKLKYLSPELQKRFHYDPVRAEKIENQQDFATLLYSKAVSQRVWDRYMTERAAAAEAETNAAFSLADPIGENSLINKTAPTITLTEWYSEKPDLSAGNCVLLFFWNSQSEPCLRAIPVLNNWQKQFTNDLIVIGVTTETEAQIQQLDAPQIQFYHGGDSASRLVRAAGVSSVPSVLFIDRDGIVRYQGHPAAITEAVLERFTGKKLAKPEPAKPAPALQPRPPRNIQKR